MEFLHSLLDNSSIPVLTAFILGILTAISPCPLATNITAIGYISKDINSRHKIFLNGILYILGRVITYTALGSILIPILREGSSMFMIQKILSKYEEALLSPLLIIIGLFMLGVIRVNLPRKNFKGEKLQRKAKGNWGAMLLGILFALAFCPTSGVFFFGMLMPLSAAESGGYLLPIVYAIATGLPVILTAWILAYSFEKMSEFYNHIQNFEKWFRKIVAIVFILVGIYYAAIFFF